MSNQIELSVQSRSDMGKGASRRLRREAGLVPGVIYGAGKKPETFSVEHRVIKKSLEQESFYTQVIDLKLDGKTEKVVLKDLQRHPYKPLIMHMDFLRIKANEKINMNIPLHFVGEDEAVGVKQEGGVISHLLAEAEVSCLPNDLPEHIEINVAELKLDETLHLSDIKLPKGVEFTALAHENDLAVINIHKQRAAVEEDTAAPEATEVESQHGGDKADDTEGDKSE